MATYTVQNERGFSRANPPLRRTFAEFFAGIGLMRIGLERQGWSIAFANDIDEQKYAMYKGHFGESGNHFVLGDIHKIAADQIPPVTLATASFPCNDLSLAGAREGLSGRHSGAFWGFTDLLEKMAKTRPPLVLLENVTGFLTSHGGLDFESALRELNRLHYTVDAFVLDAVRFVPQSRQRLFVVGTRADIFRSQCAKEPLRFYESDIRPKALAEFIFSHPEIDWHVRSLPQLPRSNAKLTDVLDDLTLDAPEWWSAERASYLLNQMSARHRQWADVMIGGKDYTYGTVFRRVRNGMSMAELRIDEIAGCLRTPRGGSGRQILFRAGKGEYAVRLLTPRECARLMGADDYKISVSLNQALFGFGDAVCVPAVEWIVQNYLDPLISDPQGKFSTDLMY